MAEAKPKLLSVEDDLDVADMLSAYFRVQEYEVLTVNWGGGWVAGMPDFAPGSHYPG
jgi:DNA-binding response OmpR family regulator